MFNDLISVIVPVYNVEKYLRKCIDSVLAQTYNNIEVILVDDGSPDNCGKICDEYSLMDSRIKVIHKENGGLSDARNKGIEAANGKYIMFVDSDDYISNTMIDTMYKHIISDDSDMVICRLLHVDEAGNVTNDFLDMCPHNNMIMSSDNILKWIAKEDILFFVVACCKLYKRSLWSDIRFPKGKLHEDEFVAHHIIGLCNLISFIDEPLYYYVQHGGSITNSKWSVKRLDAVEAYLDRTDYYFNKNYNFEAVNIFRSTISIYTYRSNKIINDTYALSRKQELKTAIKKVYVKNIYKIFKNSSFKSFLYLTLLIIDHRLFYLAVKVFRKCVIRR